MPERTEKAALTALLLLALALAGCDGGGEARRAYEQGRFEEAHDSYGAALAEAGDGASAELLANGALAAIRAGKPGDAESFAERAAARGGPEVAARALFLRGSAAFQRCGTATLQADTVEAEPFAFDVAIAYGEKARDLWGAAAATRPDWPEARRNVERALLELDEIREKKREAERRRARRANPPPKPKPLPAPSGDEEKTEEEKAAEAMNAELGPEQVLALFEKLREKEREKLELRRSRRAAAGGGKDW